MPECAFETTMEPGPEHPVPTTADPTPIPTPETRPVFPRSARRDRNTSSRIARRPQAPTPGREGATEGEPSRRAHAAPCGRSGPDGTAGGRFGRGHSTPDRRIRQRVSLREGAGRSRFGLQPHNRAGNFIHVLRLEIHDRTALSVFVSLHMGPIPHRDAALLRISVCQRREKVHARGRRSTGRWSIASRHCYTTRLRTTWMAWRNRGDTPSDGREAGPEGGLADRPVRRRGVSSTSSRGPCERSVSWSSAPRSGIRDLARSRPRRRRRTGHGRARCRDRGPRSEKFREDRRRSEVRVLVGAADRILRDLKGPFDFIFNDIDKAGYPASSSRVSNVSGSAASWSRTTSFGMAMWPAKSGPRRRRRSDLQREVGEGPAYDRDDRAAPRRGLDRVESS